MQLGYLQRKQQEKFRLGAGGKEGAEEGDPRRTSRVGVLILGFRTCLSFPQARRIVRHNGLQNTDTWRGHTQPHAAKPRRPRLPSPFLLFVGCNFKILPPPPPPLSRSLLAPSLLPGLPTSHLPPPPRLPARGATSQTNMSSKLFHFLISTFSRVIAGKTQRAGWSVYSWHN